LTALNQNRYDALLRRVGDLKGPGSKVNDALTELFPMLDVENLPSELLLLSGTRLCVGHIAVLAVGATIPQAMLRVALETSVVATIHMVSMFSETAQRIAMGPTQNVYPDPGAQAFTDGRVFGEGTVAKVLGDNLLVVGSDFYRLQIPAGTSIDFIPPKGFSVVTPGTAFSVSGTVGATPLDVSFFWSERVAQPSELNL